MRFLLPAALVVLALPGSAPADWRPITTELLAKEKKDGRYGPVFGRDAKHLFVLTGAGVVESTDGGAAWSAPVAAPPGLKGVSALTWLDYDPTADALYVMKMGSELYVTDRGK
jgi:hypothetical protein